MLRLYFLNINILKHENRIDTVAKQKWDCVISLCETDPYKIKLATNRKKTKL